MDRNVTRRDFVKGAAATAAGIALGGRMAEGALRLGGEAPRATPEKTLNHHPDMEYRRLGKTGAWVSAFCLGGHFKRIECMFRAQGTVNPYKGPENPADMDAFLENRSEVVSRCLDLGVNYIDACTGGEILTYSKVLKGHRDRVYLGYSWAEREMRKPEWQSEAKLLEGLDLGLKESGLDHVDLWRITMHEEPRNEQRGTIHTDAHLEATVGALTKAQKAGKARFVGMSSHDREWLKDAIGKYPEIQVILTPYTAASKERPKDSLFDAVRKQDVGVFGIKPFGSNALFKGDSSPGDPNSKEDDARARLAIRYILSNDAITAPIPGLVSTRQVENLALAVKEHRKLDLDASEARALEDIRRDLWARLDADHGWLRNHEFV